MIMNKISKFSSRSTAVYFCNISDDIIKPGHELAQSVGKARLQLCGALSRDFKDSKTEEGNVTRESGSSARRCLKSVLGMSR